MFFAENYISEIEASSFEKYIDILYDKVFNYDDLQLISLIFGITPAKTNPLTVSKIVKFYNMNNNTNS